MGFLVEIGLFKVTLRKFGSMNVGKPGTQHCALNCYHSNTNMSFIEFKKTNRNYFPWKKHTFLKENWQFMLKFSTYFHWSYLKLAKVSSYLSLSPNTAPIVAWVKQLPLKSKNNPKVPNKKQDKVNSLEYLKVVIKPKKNGNWSIGIYTNRRNWWGINPNKYYQTSCTKTK
jgi:hypothetical protein